MNPPKMLDKSMIFKPIYKLKQDILTPSSFMAGCQKLSEFVYKYSKETALIMLVFNAISILSSHFAQIQGLKKSSRENKDYLITQEAKECGLDIVFTILPPFAIDNFLKKQIDGGKITTKSIQEKMVKYVAPCAGASKEDLYHTDHLLPVKVQVNMLADKCIGGMLNSKKTPKSMMNVLKQAKKFTDSKMPDFNAKVPTPSLENLVIDFEESAKAVKPEIPRDVLEKFYHGSSYDDIFGFRNGVLILAALGYTVLASCVITPILKNLLSNRAYSKQLKKMGETRESIKRKERYKSLDINREPDVFSGFAKTYNNSSGITYYKTAPQSKKEVFNTFNSVLSQQKGLRI